jgi:AAHS family 4-hydroxybenzoate transporter-like MFS transporter
MIDTSEPSRVTLDALLDRSPWTAAQKWVLVLVGTALMLDGLDNYVLALAIPSIAKEWGVSPGSFWTILALGLAGLSLGTVIAGRLGDRYGRKIVLVGCVALFGAGTLAAGWADNLTQLAVLRIIAGLGMGGAVPNATTLIAEVTPINRRSLAVTVAAVSISGGGIVGGGVGAYVLPEWGWRGLFIVAGLAPIPVCLMVLGLVPESPRFLQRRDHAAEGVRRALRRLGLRPPEGGLAPAPAAAAAPRGRFLDLLAADLRWDTFALWGAFLCGVTSSYLITNWLPSTLAMAGMDPSLTSYGVQAYTAGSVIGAVIASLLIGRFSSRVLIAFAAAGVVTSLVLAFSVRGLSTSVAPLFGLIALEGACMTAVNSPLLAVAAYIYPQHIRATGTGMALTVGRVGGILSTFLGGITVDSKGGGMALFGMAAVVLLGVVVNLSLLRRHIPPTPKGRG